MKAYALGGKALQPGDEVDEVITRQAVILVGGKGTRLGALTKTTPKPLMPIGNGQVFLDEVIFDVARHGFDDIILLAGHLHQQFTERYAGKTILGANIRIVVEADPAGTGGALLNAADLLAPSFLFMNGDTAFDINLRRLDRILAADDQAKAALALRWVEDAGRFGSVTLDNGRITAFQEKKPGSNYAGSINGGIGVFRREVLEFIDRIPCSIEADAYPQMAASDVLRGALFDGYFNDIGLPETLHKAREDSAWRSKRPAIFFDRDGVLNHDAGYTHRVENLQWIPGAIDTIREANEVGAITVVVTNQAGVAHGLYGPADVEHFHKAMNDDLARHGAHLDAFYAAFHHPQAKVENYRHPDHPDRKPNPGMIQAALRDWPIAPSASLLVGDRDSDVEAARRAGIRGLLFKGDNLHDFMADELGRMKARCSSHC